MDGATGETTAHQRLRAIIAEADLLPPMRVAIVHPCDAGTMAALGEAVAAGLVVPTLIGPEHKIRTAAAGAGFDLDGVTLEAVEHSHAAAGRACELAAGRRVDAIMKGSLHTDELIGAVVAATSGLRTARRMSHLFVLDVPSYGKLLAVTDAAVNIAPTLDQKADIARNAIDTMRVLGVEHPKVAVLAAVETVNSTMPATLDAAALTVMNRRGQITDGLVDGPLAFDNAISPAAVRTKGIVSEVAGQADILLVPDLESGNMLAKQLVYLAGAETAGVMLGARVPVVLTSRADSPLARLASIALARLIVAARKADAESLSPAPTGR